MDQFMDDYCVLRVDCQPNEITVPTKYIVPDRPVFVCEEVYAPRVTVTSDLEAHYTAHMLTVQPWWACDASVHIDMPHEA